MTIYEIDKQLMNLVEIEDERWMDADTGEIFKFEDIDKLFKDRNQKIENVALYIKNLKAFEEAVQEEERKLKAKREVAGRKIENLKAYLDYALKGEKFKTPKVGISYRKSTSTQIVDESKIPQEYHKIRIDYDRVGIKEAIKGGLNVEGAKLVENTSMIIR